MENENAVQVVTADQLAATYFNSARLSEMHNLAKSFYKAQCFGKDVNNEFQALAKIQAGYEMGMPPMESMNSLYIVNGKITIWGMAMVKKLKLAGWKMKYDESVTGECKVTATKGDESYDYTATLAELRAMKSKAVEFAPKDKMRWHAISRIIRFYIPEVLDAGVGYIAEDEMTEVSEVNEVSAALKEFKTVDEVVAMIMESSNEELDQIIKDIPKLMNLTTTTEDEGKAVKKAMIERRRALVPAANVQPPKEPSTPELQAAAYASVTGADVVHVGVDMGKDEGSIETVIDGPKTQAEAVAEIFGGEVVTDENVKVDEPKKWTPKAIETSILSLDSEPAFRKFKTMLGQALNDGEVTDATYKEAINALQNRLTQFWAERAKAAEALNQNK